MKKKKKKKKKEAKGYKHIIICFPSFIGMGGVGKKLFSGFKEAREAVFELVHLKWNQSPPKLVAFWCMLVDLWIAYHLVNSFICKSNSVRNWGFCTAFALSATLGCEKLRKEPEVAVGLVVMEFYANTS
ncbi:hypothetical protein Patl1_29601 [Pistacia atlantica]|uniref:Uncharacterized protein n=1 Tax=Pistacia atlantica TaxID=434234 RepID=A0ACC1A9A4_9ROSI|nr:hypothetical protein Patl1_29601 [Pistacia atlantica]